MLRTTKEILNCLEDESLLKSFYRKQLHSINSKTHCSSSNPHTDADSSSSGSDTDSDTSPARQVPIKKTTRRLEILPPPLVKPHLKEAFYLYKMRIYFIKQWETVILDSVPDFKDFVQPTVILCGKKNIRFYFAFEGRQLNPNKKVILPLKDKQDLSEETTLFQLLQKAFSLADIKIRPPIARGRKYTTEERQQLREWNKFKKEFLSDANSLRYKVRQDLAEKRPRMARGFTTGGRFVKRSDKNAALALMLELSSPENKHRPK